MMMKSLACIVFAALLAACSTSGQGRIVDQGYTPVPAVSPAPATDVISSFTINGARGTINRWDRTIKVYLPETTTDLTSLTPIISKDSGYTVSPAGAQDFSGGPVLYTVTNGDDSTDYEVTVFNQAPTASEVNGWLGRGINVGNDLDAWPGADAEGNWTSGVKAKEYFFDDYKSLGFDSVRIPITWNDRFGKTAPFTVSSSFMSRVEQLAAWGIDRGLAVVINAHHEDWIRTLAHSAYLVQKPRFVALWTQIAAHFKDWPPQLVFEILNEPHDAMTQADVNDLNASALAAIRGTGGNNATRVVIIGGNSWNAINTLADAYGFVIPTDAPTPHLIANFHDYNPWSFAGMSQGTWGSTVQINAMKGELDTVAAWAQSHSIPLYMGEFGVTKQYQGTKPDPASRLDWYTELTKAARLKGISYVAWDDFGDFKLYDRTNRTFETAILGALKGD